MPADLDELLARADRATALPEPCKSLDELVAELEDKLVELEERWPEGEPLVEDSWEYLRFSTVQNEIDVLRWDIEGGHYVANPRPMLSAIRGGRDDA